MIDLSELKLVLGRTVETDFELRTSVLFGRFIRGPVLKDELNVQDVEVRF